MTVKNIIDETNTNNADFKFISSKIMTIDELTNFI